MFNSKQALVFIFFWLENMAKTIELSFCRKLVMVFLCVMLPGFLYGVLLFLGNYSPQFQVSGKMNGVIILKDMQRPAFSSIRDLGMEFNKCVGERGRELCLCLLGEQVLRGLTGKSSA